MNALLILSLFLVPTYAAPQSNTDQAGFASLEQAGQNAVTSSLSSAIAACSQNFQPSCTSYGISGPATVSATPTGSAAAAASTSVNSDQAAQASFEAAGQASVSSSVQSVISSCHQTWQAVCTSFGVNGPSATSPALSASPFTEVSTITSVAGPSAGTAGGAAPSVSSPGASPNPTASPTTNMTPSATASKTGASSKATSASPTGGAAGLNAGQGSALLGAVGVVAVYLL